MDLDQRIEQFEQLAAEDPSNDVAHFSLGNAYIQAGRHREAATSFERCIAINPMMSKAYQLAAEQYLALEDTEKATPLLEKGYETAVMQGDMMPKRAIAEMLEQLGKEPPQIHDPSTDEVPEGSFIDKRTGRPGTQLDAPPFKGPVGRWIYENISAESWKEWINQGTMVINELRLNLADDEDAATYDKHMREFLGVPSDVGQSAETQ